jgi:hypothetical protein
MLLNNKKVEATARVAYNADQFFSQTLSKDHEVVSWEKATGFVRHQVMAAIRQVIDNGPNGMSGKELHEARRSQLRENGWKYGAILDLEKKISPMVTSYDKLSDNQKHRDGLFLTNVASMRALWGV